MTNITRIVLESYTSPRVRRLINPSGGSCNIGEVDDTTVLKYPRIKEDMKRVQIEAKMLEVLGPHPRIIRFKGLTEDGLLLEFMPNGNVYDYLSAHPDVPLHRRLAWCVQAAEAVAYIHSRRVVHCDIRHDNFLLDANLDLKLADFQGQHFSPTGAVVLDGGSCESAKAWLPPHPADRCNVRTDLFALGSALQFFITGAEVFPDLARSSETDDDIMRWFHEIELEIERRFRAGEFPPADEHVCAAVTARCWRQLYTTADQVLADLRAIQVAIARGESPEKYVSPPDEHDQPCGERWLYGLCEEGEHPATPPIRRLIGF
ncbi:kinase-like protein [Achaetomium macrosporum]|uniref:EKC/KEOPS complex subunit BUD32 n=1 Tax=Achaetomium macrosporum TaxID=79813 RepID=A0AAN7CFX5_9PEZI|nr:kinase-like protein [Achaetomium macrosporum]